VHVCGAGGAIEPEVGVIGRVECEVLGEERGFS